MKKGILLSLGFIAIAGCQAQPEIPLGALVCEEPRPQLCTMDYRPACGYNHDKVAVKTFSNGCSACADKQVDWVIEGPCPE